MHMRERIQPWDSQKVITLKESDQLSTARIFSDNLSLAETLDQIYFIPFWQEKSRERERVCLFISVTKVLITFCYS